MHLLSDDQTWDPFPSQRHFDDAEDRRAGNRAIGVSAIGLALTGIAELAIAVLGGSVGLLGDALHNLSDVSTIWLLNDKIISPLKIPAFCAGLPVATSEINRACLFCNW